MVTGGADLTPDGEFSPLCPSSENESYEHFPQGIMVGTLLVCYYKQSHCTRISPSLSYFYFLFVLNTKEQLQKRLQDLRS